MVFTLRLINRIVPEDPEFCLSIGGTDAGCYIMGGGMETFKAAIYMRCTLLVALHDLLNTF